MEQKLNRVIHDPKAGTIYISLRPRTHRRATASIDYPGRILLDLDPEGDVYGIRLLGVSVREAQRILDLLKSHDLSGEETEKLGDQKV